MSRRMAETMDIREATEDEMCRLAAALAPIAADHDLRLVTYSEAVDLSNYGIGHGSCIDPKRLEMLASKGGAKMRCKAPRDKSQRVDCGCVSSINIGAYDTCGHGCAYCYANGTQAQVARHLAAYRPDSALLCDELRPDDRVTERSMPRFLGFP